MPNYFTTVGLEVHAELRTKTKMFCSCKNDPDEKRPNVNICPVCMAHPGTLPVINKEAVKHVLKIGIAVSGELADFTEFDRKNYFYPDIPKGYQISQYKFPLIQKGSLKGVAITRVHLEEDTARSQHTSTSLSTGTSTTLSIDEKGNYTLIDFNRAGVPLMELVTEPVIHTAEEAGAFARELQLLLRTLGAADANMEKGEMRVEANISVSSDEKKFDLNATGVGRTDLQSKSVLGTKVEVKNLNSFRSVESAIRYETKRQSEMLKRGEKVVQETRGWDENKGQTFSQRLKEESHDYRYFPDPDLPKLFLSKIPEFAPEVLRGELPELPWQRRDWYLALGMKPQEAELFVADLPLAAFFENVIAHGNNSPEFTRTTVNYLISDTLGLLAKEGKSVGNLACSPEAFGELIEMVLTRAVSSRGAKDILAVMIREGGAPADISEKAGLGQKTDETELRQVVKKVMEQNKSVVNDYQNGKEAALKFLVGAGMKESRGSADPNMLEKLFRELSMKHGV